MSINNRLRIALLSSTAMLAAACATAQPTPELVDARKAFDQAENGEANEYVPDEVHEAKTALKKAEQAHERDPGSQKEQHLGYLAHRQALLAMTLADRKKAQQTVRQADEQEEQLLLAQRNQARSELEQTREQLEDSQSELTEAQQARKEAEEAAAAALSSLNEIAMVKAENKQVVITLSGAVLFKTDKASLLPIAKNKLDKVAEVLKEHQGKEIVVEGHTDSRGSMNYNEELSQERAESVRTYLVSQGVPSNAIKAVGRGENDPIAANSTAEGRANNRRVEIIIGDEKVRTASR